jgi:hypothetical protein
MLRPPLSLPAEYLVHHVGILIRPLDEQLLPAEAIDLGREVFSSDLVRWFRHALKRLAFRYSGQGAFRY